MHHRRTKPRAIAVTRTQTNKRAVAAGAWLVLIGLLVVGLAQSVAYPQSESRQVPDYGINLQRYDYPFKVHYLDIPYINQTLKMAYMDVMPDGEPKGVVLLLHGKNFNGAYFERTANDLRDLGYRVVIPDQIGFGKSTKPRGYQFSFVGLAENTKSLLDKLGIEKASVLGHSMGGMVASRFALCFPETTEQLILLNPIGLEDWAQKGVPYRGMNQWYQRELNKSAEGVKSYQLNSYYDGRWKPEYQTWVDLLVGTTTDEHYPRLAKVQAQTYDMIYTQPVVHDFPQITAPTLLIIGQRDRTALGKDLVSEELKNQLGRYPELGRAAKEAIPNASLVELDDVGHLPHIEAYERFMDPLKSFLQSKPN